MRSTTAKLYLDGKTPLHKLILACQDIEIIKEFIREHTLQIMHWAKCIDDTGKLPIELLETSPLSQINQKQARELLLPFTLPYSGTQQFPAEFATVLKQFPAKKGSKLYHNLELGYQAVKQTRETLVASLTGPSANTLDEKEKERLDTKISVMRTLCKVELKEMLKVPLDLSQETHRLAYIQVKTDLAIAHGVGNCEEYSFVTRHFIKELDSKANVVLYALSKQKGDHLFIILDPDTPDAVVIDALLGKIFPQSFMMQYLNGLKRIKINAEGHEMNCYARFNPKFHQVKAYYPVPASASSATVGVLPKNSSNNTLFTAKPPTPDAPPTSPARAKPPCTIL